MWESINFEDMMGQLMETVKTIIIRGTLDVNVGWMVNNRRVVYRVFESTVLIFGVRQKVASI